MTAIIRIFFLHLLPIFTDVSVCGLTLPYYVEDGDSTRNYEEYQTLMFLYGDFPPFLKGNGIFRTINFFCTHRKKTNNHRSYMAKHAHTHACAMDKLEKEVFFRKENRN